MSQPVKEFQKGKMKVALWEGEYKGEVTYSFSIQKSYMDKDKKWQNTNFFTEPDLRDLMFVLNSICLSAVKSRKIEPKQETQEIITEDSEVPF